METMRAAMVRAFGEPLRIEEVPVPRPGPGEVLVKVVATGVCHTDLHAADGDWPVKPRLPFVPGHEGAGIVAAVGAGVTGLKEGDPVGVALGCTTPAAPASTAGPAGRRSASTSATAATASTAASPSTSLGTLPMSAVCRGTRTSP
jgi:D-arabinose 1-dehydrogenase-like Zn-dependent alcohol dehydrogenase